MRNLFVFNQLFKGKSKKNDKEFYVVLLFERRQAQDGSIYFKETRCFVNVGVYEHLLDKGYKFGDIVSIETAPPVYFGGPEQLIDLSLIQESPYYDL